jgi:MerR family transcriptional regulator, activator of bmr gene
MKETLYTIGEVSKLANVSIKALRYYDKINLFKPAYVDPNTNYRYYNDSQLHHLDLIKSLKYIGTPIEDMKKAQELKTNEFFTFLTEQEDHVNQKLLYLLEIKQTIEDAKKRINRQKKYPSFGEVFLLEENEIRIVQTTAEGVDPINILTATYSKLKIIIESTDGFMSHDYGSTFLYQPYTHINEITYRHIFAPILTNKQILSLTPDMKVTTIPQGKYVCIAYIYSQEDFIQSLQKLINYIDSHQLTVISDVYEFVIPIHYSPNQQEEYMGELKIQVT